MTGILLFDYWRSSASYRVRIALNLKGVDYQAVPTSLLAGEQRNEDYLARNPQGLVPMLHIDGVDISQSLAIIDYLDARFPEPRLIPADPLERATALAFAQVIAADIHPLNNLRVLKYLKRQMGQEQDAIDDWYRHWVAEGFAALEAMAPDSGFLGGDAPNVADVFLVPQMYNARRLETPLDACPRLVRIDAALNGIETIAAAAPERVKPDE
ncbi:MAG: maleylacetoacetate isomerase [Blastomonas sp.]